MAQTVSLGRLFDIRVGIHVSWLIIYAIATWSIASSLAPTSLGIGLAIGAACALLLFASVIVHEFAHALVARRFDVRTSVITLFIFGGVATIEREPPTPTAEIAIALAGPGASLALAAIAGLAFRIASTLPVSAVTDVIVLLLEYIAIANGMLGLFNLIPAFPMDGGRVLRAILWQRGGSQNQATASAALVGMAFALLIALTGLVVMIVFHGWQYLWNVVLGVFLVRATLSTYRHARKLTRLERVRVGDIMETDPRTLQAENALSGVECEGDTTVIEDGNVVGVLSAREHRFIPLGALPSLTPASTAIDAADAFHLCSLTCLPVVLEGRLLGVVERARIIQLQSDKKAA